MDLLNLNIDMGANKKKRSKNKVVSANGKPFVSVCTPTYNRRKFIPQLIKCFKNQNYPKQLMEWIVVDDGDDSVEDLFKGVECVKYFKYDNKMKLGKKRNVMHEKATGDIIVYMDDDDYYPPQRVQHSVDMLTQHKKALCAGASEIYIYFKHVEKMVQFGPYGPNHATAGTFAFKRELLKQCRYEDTASLAEEKAFLKNYTIPFVQLEPKKTILVFSHIHNTFDKKKLLDNGQNNFQKESNRTVEEFVKEAEIREFYMDVIDKLLENYEPGHPKNKPDVLKQIKEIDEERKKMISKQQGEGKIVLNQNGENIELNNQQIVQIMQKQQEQLQKLSKILQEKDEKIKELEEEIMNMRKLDLINDNNINSKLDRLIELAENSKNQNMKLEIN